MRFKFLIIVLLSFLMSGCLVDGVKTNLTLDTSQAEEVKLIEGYYNVNDKRPLRLEFINGQYLLGPTFLGDSERFNIYKFKNRYYIQTAIDSDGLKTINQVELKEKTIKIFHYDSEVYSDYSKELNSLSFGGQIYSFICSFVTITDECLKYNIKHSSLVKNDDEILYLSARNDKDPAIANKQLTNFLIRYGFIFFKNNEDAISLNYVSPLNSLNKRFSSNLECLSKSKDKIMNNNLLSAAVRTPIDVVLLVHGLELIPTDFSLSAIKERQRSNWSKFARLNSSNTVVCHYVWDSSKGLYDQASLFMDILSTISRQMKHQSDSKLTLVGHSQGGNYIKYALGHVKDNADDDDKLKEFLENRVNLATLSTPHYGSKKAELSALGFGVSILLKETTEGNWLKQFFRYGAYTELKPNSESLRILEGNSIKKKIKIQTLAIHAEDDFIVNEYSALWGRSRHDSKSLVLKGDHFSIQSKSDDAVMAIKQFAELK